MNRPCTNTKETSDEEYFGNLIALSIWHSSVYITVQTVHTDGLLDLGN